MTVSDLLARYLGHGDWRPSADGTRFAVPAAAPGGDAFLVEVVAVDDLPGVVAYAAHPDPVLPERFAAAAAALARMNDGLPIGGFELDHATGAIRARASLEAPADELTDAAIDRLVRAVVALMGHHFADLSALHTGG